jgi:hypothetical protein
MECGIRVENFDDVKVGDILESYSLEEIRSTSSAHRSSAGEAGC